MRVRLIKLLALWLLVACGDDAIDGGDAATMGEDASISSAPLPPLAPEAPALPADPTAVTLTPCPDGWEVVAPARPNGATLCSPGSEPFAACDPGLARFAGQNGCAELATCDAIDGFPMGAPASGDVRFVRAGASGGDGSRATPFGTLAAALMGAAVGSTVVLSDGDHAGGVTISAGVTVMGVCATDTRIVGTIDAPALVVDGAGAVVEALSIRSADAALSIGPGVSTLLRAVDVEGAANVEGILALERVALREGEIRVGAEGTVIGDRVHGSAAQFIVSGGSLELVDSLLVGGEVAVKIESGGGATLERSVIANALATGILVSGADSHAALTDVLVQDIRDGFGGGDGVVAEDAAALVAERFAIVRAGGSGILSPGGELDLRDVAVIDAGIDAEPMAGGGVRLAFEAHLEAVGLSVEGAHSLSVSFFRSSGYLEDVFILDSVSVGELDGAGLLTGSSHVAVRRGLVSNSGIFGVMASDPQGQLRLEDVQIVDTRSASGLLGRGLAAQVGAKVVVSRVFIENAIEDGIFASSRDATVTGSDVTVSETQPATMGALAGIGIGIHAQEGALVDLSRVEVSESTGLGVVLISDGTRGRLRDLIVRDTRSWERAPLDESLLGRGIDLQRDADLIVERALIVGNRDAGIGVSAGCELTLIDVEIRETRDDGGRGRGGRGLAIHGSSLVHGRRLLFQGNRDVSVAAYAEGTIVDLEDLVIRSTMQTACAEDGCTPGGIGLGAYALAAVTARRFLVEDSALAGVQVAELGGLDLSGGVVRGSPIGASVNVDGYDVMRLSDDVRYEDNGTNLDSTALPVPAPGASFDSMGEM